MLLQVSARLVQWSANGGCRDPERANAPERQPEDWETARRREAVFRTLAE